MCTPFIVKVGNDTPMKKPMSTPAKVVKITLVESAGFLPAGLQTSNDKEICDQEISYLPSTNIMKKL